MTQLTTIEHEPEAHATEGSALFDGYGRRVPPVLEAAVHKTSRRYFRCLQPAVDYGQIHSRITRHLGIVDAIPREEFELRAQAILERAQRDVRIANLVRGVGVPFFLPRARYTDLGAAFGDVYLGAVERAHREAMPDFRFVDHHGAPLNGRLRVAPGSRHERLLESMQKSQVVGYYFPCLTEFSVPAALAQMKSLPEELLLAGGFDTAAAFIGSPDLLLRKDGYPPLLWLAALLDAKDGVAYHFEAYGYNLTFNRRPHLNKVAEYWASALVLTG